MASVKQRELGLPVAEDEPMAGDGFEPRSPAGSLMMARVLDRDNVIRALNKVRRWIACALAQRACQEGYAAQYLRLPRLLHEPPIVKGDGRYSKLLASLAKVDVLILDDWRLSRLNAEQAGICWRSWKIGMTCVPPSSLVNCRSINGTNTSATLHWQMPFWIAWYTTLTRST